MNLDDTIVAIASPPGRGGIGVVRLAGPKARAIANPMLRLKRELEPGRAVFGELIEPSFSHVGAGTLGEGGQPARFRPDGAVLPPVEHSSATVSESDDASVVARTKMSSPRGDRIDEVVVTYFAKPNSYTTDDIVEISTHGSPVVLRYVVEIALARGARLAEPGEFTMRAFLNGRIDLTQAEAVRDLIESRTLYQAKVAAQQLEGALSHRLQPIKQRLVELIALLEAGIDFAEDDVAVLAAQQILDRLAEMQSPLNALAQSFAYGKIVHEGLTLAIVGRPNVGKSSLFNRLVEREHAIVTAMPGTTRDLVTETVSLEGIPLKLVDTAGIRNALDEAELIGIKKSMEALADADLVLIVLDASQPITSEDRELIEEVQPRPAIVVMNKADLASAKVSDTMAAEPEAWTGMSGPQEFACVRTSALTGEGISELRTSILREVLGESGGRVESGFLTNARQQALVRDSLKTLAAVEKAVHNRIPHEMLLLDLYNALRPLDEITGATTSDDILNLIFSRFCIGK